MSHTAATATELFAVIGENNNVIRSGLTRAEAEELSATHDNSRIVDFVTEASTKPDLSQCTYVTDKGRRCKLPANHVDSQDKDIRTHRMILRDQVAKPKTLAELREAHKGNAAVLKGFNLQVESVPTTEDVSREYSREAEPRDQDQIKVDADAKKNYDAWVKRGKPDKTFDELGKMGLLSRYIFPPVAFDTIILMLRRATQTGGPVNGKRLSYRRKAHTSGNTMVYFIVTDSGTKKADS